MLRMLSLVLPVFFPSWRFFKTIEPSPRVEWAQVAAKDGAASAWREVRSRPGQLSLFEMVRRLIWNPDRNAELFVVSCAERIQQEPTDHSIGVIQRFIQAELAGQTGIGRDTLVQFRLVFVHRKEAELLRDIVFQSDAFLLMPEGMR